MEELATPSARRHERSCEPDWRSFYEIDESKRMVFLTAADHRKQAYRYFHSFGE